MEWYIGCLKKYAEFSGRARRTELWMFTLVNFIISIVLGFVLPMLAKELMMLSTIYSLGVMIPGIAVGARRMHDIGKSGWWLLISLIPIIGWIILLVFYCQDSMPGENQYGPNPKAQTAA